MQPVSVLISSLLKPNNLLREIKGIYTEIVVGNFFRAIIEFSKGFHHVKMFFHISSQNIRDQHFSQFFSIFSFYRTKDVAGFFRENVESVCSMMLLQDLE